MVDRGLTNGVARRASACINAVNGSHRLED